MIVGGVASALVAPGLVTPAGASDDTLPGIFPIVIDDTAPGRLISPLIYGSSEIGTADGGARSAELDRAAHVTARRLGGNLMTAYNWVNNATNAGKDFQHANGAFLLDMLGVPDPHRTRPAAVIEAMHHASLAMGAKSLVTLPLAGFVAADFGGPVAAEAAAPSARFVPVRWRGHAGAADPIDPKVADIPQLLARLVQRFGGADTPDGIHAYALDNEPGLWFENHPRIVTGRMPIRTFIERSVAAARAIKAADPAAAVFGPVCWGATEMVDFQQAPDWNEFRHYGSFIAAYLDTFRAASARAGQRLLDVLDIHWYPFSRRGSLFRTEQPDLAEALLDAPRSLTEPGFREDSWVADVLPVGDGEALALPLLPSLERLIARRYPGTRISVTEFNFGGAGQLVSGLALADVLGRFGAAGVYFACHWGSLAGWLGEAYRLFRVADATGAPFGGRALGVATPGGPAVTAYAAAGAAGAPLHLVVLNKATQAAEIEVAFASGRSPRLLSVRGFDAAHPATTTLPAEAQVGERSVRIALPARAARRFTFA
ncbi:glycoside hydrolase family 44 protein [Blastochloris viridis]|uniref:Endoglucanase A n=1 Tax=Blastochloris viridis TaxID=1079 RepID=A0A182D2R0_BLAVI|nr:glycoside hydrolase family 44 protein [Blastochloris viridis]BAR99247.1 endoglucanase A precursor [Blastochloris viridis]